MSGAKRGVVEAWLAFFSLLRPEKLDSVKDSQKRICENNNGTLLSWGDVFSGSLGYGSLDNRALLGLVSQTGVRAGKRVVSIGATSHHTVVLCSDGTQSFSSPLVFPVAPSQT